MDLANASLYDRASSVAEACMIALSYTNKNKIIYSSTINDNIIITMKTCLHGKSVEFIILISR